MRLRSASRGVWLAILAAALVVGTPNTGQARRSHGAPGQEQKLSKEQRQEAEAAVKLVDAVMSGAEPAETPAFTITWHNDSLKAQESRTYVPFSISFPGDALTVKSVTFYVRVVSRAAVAEAAEAKAPTPYAFEAIWFPELAPPAAGRPYELSRAFAVPAGDYDVYVLIRERTKDKRAKPRSSVLAQPTTVPDYWNGEFTTSSVILADGVEQLTQMPTPEEQVEKPYTINTMQITPAADTVFATGEELAVVFLVYNPTLKDKKPDVQVEYRFHQKTADGEKYFNRTPPNVLNADTLGPGFDLDAGYQLVAGQSVPLASFPPGDYRLEIEVLDKLAERALTRDVFFTVAGS